MTVFLYSPGRFASSIIGAVAQPYESDITRMIRELLREKPHIVEEQKKSRAMWWDQRPDLEADRARQQSALTQPAYVYGSPIAKKPR
jgi:hypothetical protein